MIEYKGYIGAVNFDPEIDLFHGTAINTSQLKAILNSARNKGR